MVNSAMLRTIFILIVISIAGIFFNNTGDDFVKEASALSSKVACPVVNATNEITAHGMPFSTIKDIEQMDQQRFSIYIYNRVNGNYEVYVYDIGRDLRWNTRDDMAHLLESFGNNEPTPYISPFISVSVLDLLGGNRTNIYWMGIGINQTREIKSCSFDSARGCGRRNVITSFPASFYLQGFNVNYKQDKLYIAHTDSPNATTQLEMTTYWLSCSLNSKYKDACTKPISNYSMELGGSYQYLYHKRINNVGFLTEPMELLDINTPSNISVIQIPNIAYVAPIAPRFLVTVQREGALFNRVYTGYNVSLIAYGATNLTLLSFPLDYVPQGTANIINFVDPYNIGVYYRSNLIGYENNTLFKDPGMSQAISIYQYNPNIGLIYPEVVVNNVRLGLTEKSELFRFTC